MKKLLSVLILTAIPIWSASITVGPSRTYTTIQAGINAMLPLNEDLVVYIIVPSLSYTTQGTISPTSSWNGYGVKVVGVKTLPTVIAYGEDGKVLEVNGEGKLAFSYDLIDGVEGVEGRFTGTQMSVNIKDRLGSTRMTLLGDGVISEAQMYYSYGRAVSLKASATITREKFTGKEHDNEGIAGGPGIDLDYFGARYYDPDLGMWISPDPVRQYHSPYDYTGGNPVNLIDPDGRCAGCEYVLMFEDPAFKASVNKPFSPGASRLIFGLVSATAGGFGFIASATQAATGVGVPTAALTGVYSGILAATGARDIVGGLNMMAFGDDLGMAEQFGTRGALGTVGEMVAGDQGGRIGTILDLGVGLMGVSQGLNALRLATPQTRNVGLTVGATTSGAGSFAVDASTAYSDKLTIGK